MVEKEIRYTTYPTEQHRVHVNVRTFRGNVVDFAVQLEVMVEGQAHPVLRYDASHGKPHYDFLDPRGRVVEKHWFPIDISLGEALTFKERDLRANHGSYTKEFFERGS